MIDFQNCAFKLRQVKDDTVTKDISPLLIQEELILGVYKAVRDYVVFTSKRIIAVNAQGMTGKKKDFTSLPFSKVQAFSLETSGVFDLDSELELYFSGLGKVKFEFMGTNNIVEIGRIIGNYVL